MLQIVIALFVIGIVAFGTNKNGSNNSEPNVATVGPTQETSVGNFSDTPAAPSNTSITPKATHFVIKDGYDALGDNLDILSMPLRVVSPSDCQEVCAKNSACKSFVFNKALKSCFLKRSVGTLVQNEVAYLGYSDDMENLIHISPIQTLQHSGFIGYLSGIRRNTRWSDCVLDCDQDQTCVAFNYDNKLHDCTKFRTILRKLGMPTISSGVKAGPGR
jgi:hypothetical protein